MPGTKRNDSHRNNHQHHFFHTDKGKKTNLPAKPIKRQLDLYEKTFQEKSKLGAISDMKKFEEKRLRQESINKHIVELQKILTSPNCRQIISPQSWFNNFNAEEIAGGNRNVEPLTTVLNETEFNLFIRK